MAVGRLASVAVDCADPVVLGRFWAALVGGRIVRETPEVVLVALGDLLLAYVRIDGYRPPDWPADGVPKQFHHDVAVDDLDAAVGAAVELGAVVPAGGSIEDYFRVLLLVQWSIG